MPTGLPQLSATCRATYGSVSERVGDFVDKLEFPSAQEYWSSWRLAFRDMTSASVSVWKVLYLTFRPLVLLLVMLAKWGWVVAKFLAHHLLKNAYISSKHGWSQFKIGIQWFIQWQRSLSRAALLMEFAIVTTGICCWYLRRYIQKKKYVQRVTTYYKRRKRMVKKRYKQLVHRISRTSRFLAMLLPHLIFVGLTAAIKIILPRFVSWLACDTIATAMLSLLYPFVCTISLLHQWRGRHHVAVEQTRASASETTPTRGTRSGLYPRTTPASKAAQRWLAAATPSKNKKSQLDMEDEANYWLKYWVVYALFTAACRMCILIPLWGRVLSRVAISGWLQELRLVFIVWIFCLSMLVGEVDDEDFENRPVEILFQKCTPPVVSFFHYTSNAIPSSVWQKIVSQLETLLNALVMFKFFSEETKQSIIHVAKDSRPFLPPAVTLFMPGFVTEYGVIYVKSIVPVARSHEADMDATNDSTMSVLEYWVLWVLVDGVLQWWSSLLWWIPFSTHAIFIVWCRLQFNTTGFYKAWEEELMSFGLLARLDSTDKFELNVDRTVTARVLQSLYKSLPSAAEEAETAEQPNAVGPNEQVEEPVQAGPTADAEVLTENQNNVVDDNRLRRRTRSRSSSSSSSDGGTKLRRSSRRTRQPLHASN